MTNETVVQLRIDKESSVSSIQNEFNKIYPFLKICFLKNSISPKEILLDEIALSKKVVNPFADFINISKERTVAELVIDLRDLFKMPVLIFRKSGNVWVETSLTEDWTLEEQNKEGEQISFHFL